MCKSMCAHARTHTHTYTQLFSELTRFNVQVLNLMSAKEETDIKMELQKEKEKKGKC